MGFSFENKKILVTGAAGGLGKSIVKQFIEAGARVYALDYNQDQINDLKKEFPTVSTLCVDLQDWEATAKTVHDLGPLDHLVNNAGVADNEFAPDISQMGIDRSMDVNYKAPFNVSQVFAKNVIANSVKGATIVNVSSICDRLVVPGIASYSCSKAALSMLTKCLAVEFGGHDIRVNAILPTAMDTPMFAKSRTSSGKMEEGTGNLIARTPIKGLLETSDAANLVLYLSSPLSKMITGTCVPIDGGLSVT